MIVIAVPIPEADRPYWMQAAQRSAQDETFNTAPPQTEESTDEH